jgi:hypothetical protein
MASRFDGLLINALKTTSKRHPELSFSQRADERHHSFTEFDGCHCIQYLLHRNDGRGGKMLDCVRWRRR